MEQGRQAVCHPFGGPTVSLPELYPMGIYAVPKISMVGKTELQPTEKGIPYEAEAAWYKELGRGQLLGDDIGRLKLLITRSWASTPLRATLRKLSTSAKPPWPSVRRLTTSLTMCSTSEPTRSLQGRSPKRLKQGPACLTSHGGMIEIRGSVCRSQARHKFAKGVPTASAD